MIRVSGPKWPTSFLSKTLQIIHFMKNVKECRDVNRQKSIKNIWSGISAIIIKRYHRHASAQLR